MGRWRERLQYWMSGRYGADEFSRFLFVCYLVLFVASLILRRFAETLWIAFVLDLLVWAVIVWSLYRMFSRKIHKRYAENQRYLAVRGRVKGWFKLTGCRLRDMRTKRYRRCPHCRAVVRFPVKRGVHIVSCPHCREKFELKIRL